MSGGIPLLPQYAFMAWCLGKYRDNFTFTFVIVKQFDIYGLVRDVHMERHIDCRVFLMTTLCIFGSLELYVPELFSVWHSAHDREAARVVMGGWRDRQREEMYGREMTNVPRLLVARHPRKPQPFVSRFLSAEHSDPSLKLLIILPDHYPLEGPLKQC
jgi:hypothetical protein